MSDKHCINIFLGILGREYRALNYIYMIDCQYKCNTLCLCYNEDLGTVGSFV